MTTKGTKNTKLIFDVFSCISWFIIVLFIIPHKTSKSRGSFHRMRSSFVVGTVLYNPAKPVSAE